MPALVVGSLIVGVLVCFALNPAPATTWAIGHIAMGGLLVYLLARELTRHDPVEPQVDRSRRRSV